eukprot:jgi/Mesen1/9377/ME000610S08686
MADEATKTILEKQRFFQSARNLVHLKAPGDRITSVIVPGVLVAAGAFLIGRGVWNLSHGVGKKA